uniref:Ig-like domain-containing protein n=1 Tax=Poecilia mexicana TaxID=48701 RepID=A0A3B3YS79_9TELE
RRWRGAGWLCGFCLDLGSAAQPFSPFWFTVEPQDTLAIRGNSALLNCSAHSDEASPARIEWKKDGTFMSLVSDERRRVLPDGSLFFASVVHSKHNKPDEGTYQCVANIENVGSISSRTARLAVAGKGLSLFFLRLALCINVINLCF